MNERSEFHVIGARQPRGRGTGTPTLKERQ